VKKVSAKKTVDKMKKAQAKSTVGASGPNKWEKYIAEVIAVLKTAEKPRVSLNKIKAYILDYFDVRPHSIPKMVTKALFELQTRKLLKAKKNPFEFTVAGRAPLTPAKIEKKKKIFRLAKKGIVKPAKEKSARRPIITSTGRVSKPRANEKSARR
jgi:hypothetical protein